ncbi:MAG: ThuA domain-containing protein [Flavobacteriaceae bacterium]|nr:ThuA domain-containing protein [Flavobacteriaceae bacterium]MCY4217158.1 ThuA domain-containing protein [Flavobacteriaceae bacterium]MCY4254388.1 ThuA domain-containing protein [Flavobacteriaceae bacterium]
MAFVILLSFDGYGQTAKSTLDGKKVLLVYGGWDGHQPKIKSDIMSQWLIQEKAEVIVSNSTEIYADSNVMYNIDLVIQIITMSEIKENEIKGLLDGIKSGIGFAGFHGGMGDSFRSNTQYQYMVGGQFVSHPGGQLNYKVHIIDKQHPITKGMKDYSVHTEQYYMHVDPNNTVLATTVFKSDAHQWIQGAVIPVVWIKYFGKGRVFYSSLGHAPKDIMQPESWEILTRGIRWAAESKFIEHQNLLNPIYEY